MCYFKTLYLFLSVNAVIYLTQNCRFSTFDCFSLCQIILLYFWYSFQRIKLFRVIIIIIAISNLLQGGSGEQLKVQLLAVVAISVWSLLMSFIFLKLVTLTLGLRVSEEEEILGADIVEHNCGDLMYDKKKKKVCTDFLTWFFFYYWIKFDLSEISYLLCCLKNLKSFCITNKNIF